MPLTHGYILHVQSSQTWKSCFDLTGIFSINKFIHEHVSVINCTVLTCDLCSTAHMSGTELNYFPVKSDSL